MTEELTHSYIQSLLPKRVATDHKGSFGHLLVLAGARGYIGAALLCSQAAARSGVGLVTLGIPYALGDIIDTRVLEVMTLRLSCTAHESFALEARGQALVAAATRDAVVLGPGITTHPETCEFVYAMVTACNKPMVLDADALNALSQSKSTLQERIAPTVLTPHPGEMARLLNTTTDKIQAKREKSAQSLASQCGHVVVLKGHHTIIATPQGKLWKNTTGNHGMATGGAGDVLSGIIGGLLAQGMAPKAAACLGVYVHGLAGDIAAREKSARAMIASDLIEALPQAWNTLETDS